MITFLLIVGGFVAGIIIGLVLVSLAITYAIGSRLL